MTILGAYTIFSASRAPKAVSASKDPALPVSASSALLAKPAPRDEFLDFNTVFTLGAGERYRTLLLEDLRASETDVRKMRSGKFLAEMRVLFNQVNAALDNFRLNLIETLKSSQFSDKDVESNLNLLCPSVERKALEEILGSSEYLDPSKLDSYFKQVVTRVVTAELYARAQSKKTGEPLSPEQKYEKMMRDMAPRIAELEALKFK